VSGSWNARNGTKGAKGFREFRGLSRLSRSNGARSHSTRRLDESLGWNEEAFKALVKILVGKVQRLSDLVGVYRAHSPAYLATQHQESRETDGGSMTQVEILEELEGLTTTERLTIIEAALRLIREDLQHIEPSPAQAERKQQLAAAAEALLPDYAAGGELTSFTALDSEDFYAQG